MSLIESVTFDKPSYAPGETVTMTVRGDWGRLDDLTVTTGDGGSQPAQLTLIHPVACSDGTGRSWQVVSNTGNEAVLTSVA